SPGCHSRHPAGSIFACKFACRNTTVEYGRQGRPKKYMRRSGLGGYRAMIKHVSTHLIRIMFILRREENCIVGDSMNFASLKICLGVAENEIYIPLNVTVGKILPSGHTRALIRCT